jgi:hypothetical protein
MSQRVVATTKIEAVRIGINNKQSDTSVNYSQKRFVSRKNNRRKQPGQKITPCKKLIVFLFVCILTIFFFLVYQFVLKDFRQNTALRTSQYLEDDFNSFPERNKQSQSALATAGPTAYAIPVGGKTQRLHLLKRLLISLIQQNVNPANIFVFEDDTSRPTSFFAKRRFGKNSHEELQDLCKLYKVNLLKSNVVRNRKEKRSEFGLFLARHYHFMLDTLLYNGKSTPLYTVSRKNKFLFGHRDPRQQELHETIRARNYEYVIILEDDLELADDAVNFFNSMTWPMSKDASIFCACAHQDNAYHSTSSEENSVVNTSMIAPVQKERFIFRRGEHFMAPGWMTSKSIYNSVIRPTWFDLHGELLPWARVRLYNGNWDTYLDFRVEGMECIYPAIPRIAHRGAQGYTVRKDRQDAVFGSLRLSTRDSRAVTGEYYKKQAMELVHYQYDDNMYKFIKAATVVTCLEEVEKNIRNSNVVYHLAASSAADNQWIFLFKAKLGLIAVGGHTPRMRGIHRGTVFLNYMSNLILVVATYSPYSNSVMAKKRNDNSYIFPNFIGCYKDNYPSRDLPVIKDTSIMVKIQGKNALGPEKCACKCKGYKYFSLQNGGECFCGNTYGKYGVDATNKCKKKCLVNDPHGNYNNEDLYCGGSFSNAVYDRTTSFLKEQKYIHEKELNKKEIIVVSNIGESCTETCARTKAEVPTKTYACLDAILPKLLFTGAPRLLRSNFNCKSKLVYDGSVTKYRNVAPAINTNGNGCYTTVGRHLMCKAKMKNVRRLCVCVEKL